MKTLSQIEIKKSINTPPEIELILNCVSPFIDTRITENIKELVKEQLDWEYFYQTVRIHGVTSLVYIRLNDTCPGKVPDSIMSQLRGFFYTNTQRSLFMTGELVRLLKLFQEAEIIAVPYKGPVLGSLIYNNIAIRYSCDLDIIVEEKNIFAVKDILIAQGYRPKREMNNKELIAYLGSKAEHTYDFIHDEKNFFLEIHWRLAPKVYTNINPKDFWQELEPFPLADIHVNNIPLEYYLSILSMHGSRHIWTRLAWLCDFATLIHKYPDLDWKKAINQAEMWNCKRILCLGLSLAKSFFNITLPQEVLEEIEKDNMINSLAIQVYNQLFAEIKTSERKLGRTLYHLRSKERVQDKLLYFQSFLLWITKLSWLREEKSI
ncbi:MAG: nucleotidyltransferase family protein [Cyanobacteria bacterium P01_A01_bin.84]